MDVHGLFIHLLLDAQLGFFLVLSFDLKKKLLQISVDKTFCGYLFLLFLGQFLLFDF